MKSCTVMFPMQWMPEVLWVLHFRGLDSCRSNVIPGCKLKFGSCPYLVCVHWLLMLIWVSVPTVYTFVIWVIHIYLYYRSHIRSNRKCLMNKFHVFWKWTGNSHRMSLLAQHQQQNNVDSDILISSISFYANFLSFIINVINFIFQKLW